MVSVKFVFKAFIYWLPLAATITLICGLFYFLEQQHLRISANDPQIQLAEDISAALSQDRPLESVLSLNTRIDLSKSLAPYVNFYDSKGQPAAGTGFLDNKLPTIPAGVFTYTKTHGQDRVTWQPRAGVRQAIVVRSYQSKNDSGFVVVGRSLREIENRETILFRTIVIALVVILFSSFLFVWLQTYYFPPSRR